MTFNPVVPICNVETLFKTYSTSIHPTAECITQNDDPKEKLPDMPIVPSVIQVLNYTNILEAQELAEKLNISDRKLSCAVELLTGLPLGKFIKEWRFLQSQELLLHTELPYSEIASQCGYNNESSLILIYEKRLKTTPHIFRTGYRIINGNYAFNRHGYSNRLNYENRGAKNKVYSKK